MTRKIKFRAWIPESKEFVYWSLLPFFLAYRTPSYQTIFTKDISLKYTQQFTGLKDKNGKEIYGGDILNDPTCEVDGKPLQEIVDWNQDRCGFEPFCLTYSDGDPVIVDVKDWVVIGNIYENKELLPQASQA